MPLVVTQTLSLDVLARLFLAASSRWHSGRYATLADGKNRCEKPVRQAFAEMPHDQPQLRKPVEHAGENDPQQMQAGLDRESVDRAFQSPLREGSYMRAEGVFGCR